MNDKNLAFYNNLGVDPFRQLSQIGGFDTWSDLEIIWPYISDAESIVELGAGYGRCLDFFLKKKYQGKLIAVEKSVPYLQYLRGKYTDNVTILEKDIKNLKLDTKVDAILWMFSGIIDFSPEEQKASLINLGKYLTDKGKLVIDVPRIGFKTYATHTDEKRLTLNSPYGVLECYIPDIEDMRRYQEAAGFEGFFRHDYLTSTDKARTIYVLFKQN
jgi:SAM-dependent methyltransferase